MLLEQESWSTLNHWQTGSGKNVRSKTSVNSITTQNPGQFDKITTHSWVQTDARKFSVTAWSFYISICFEQKQLQ